MAVSILAPRCRGAHPIEDIYQWMNGGVSILAPRCRGAHHSRRNLRMCGWLFQSSRPVAGARINTTIAVTDSAGDVSILAPRCRGAHRCCWHIAPVARVVSILAPRCRGAHPPPPPRNSKGHTFQSSRPVAGARIARIPFLRSARSRFNPRAPLPGRASSDQPYLRNSWFVSILAPRCRGAHLYRHRLDAFESSVSILAPRCRGAHLAMARRMRPLRTFQSSRPVAGARISSRVTGGNHGHFGTHFANRRSNHFPCFHWIPNQLTLP